MQTEAIAWNAGHPHAHDALAVLDEAVYLLCPEHASPGRLVRNVRPAMEEAVFISRGPAAIENSPNIWTYSLVTMNPLWRCQARR